jgi:hypothetical protein
MTYLASRRKATMGWLVWGMMLQTSLGLADTINPVDEPLSYWNDRFALEVDHRLDVPLADQALYIGMLLKTLAEAKLEDLTAQAFVVVDRSPTIQAAFVVLLTPSGQWHWVGATSVSTGKMGTFEHFLSPRGVFAHSLDNPDYRSEGTYNKNHIRGYGVRGLRVFDFGWQFAQRGWGVGGTSPMRLEMHATDPQVLEPNLGLVASEGCIRIPATLNRFIDRHGLLDADYEAARATGEAFWVLKHDRQVAPWPGRYMVIIDSQAAERPPWSPVPGSMPVSNRAFALKGTPHS